MTDMLKLSGVGKDFTLHVQGGTQIPVFEGLHLTVAQGESVALVGASGTGKSTLMRMIHANYTCPRGEILIRHEGEWVDIASAHPHLILDIRRRTLGHVSQFLRVVPRVPTLDIVAEPLRALGLDAEAARDRARALLSRLNVPERLWSLSPMTFSGGEQQRVNIARGFIHPYPILLLDEPTASLDPANREVVLSLIQERRARGTAILGIYHDADVRDLVSDRGFETAAFRQVAA